MGRQNILDQMVMSIPSAQSAFTSSWWPWI